MTGSPHSGHFFSPVYSSNDVSASVTRSSPPSVPFVSFCSWPSVSSFIVCPPPILAGMTERILVTGAAGYIGSHACLELIEAGFEVVALDNLSNSSVEAIRRVEKLTGVEIPFHEVDLVDEARLNEVFDAHGFGAVMHFAGMKAVGESVEIPLRYYQNNLIGTMNLL